MNPYPFVYEATKNGESLLSLCCGVGFELVNLNTTDVTAVDIAPQYLEQVTNRCPEAETICSDALEYVKTQEDDSVDVISIIDGIEHMDKSDGLELIKEMKRVAKHKILLFTPQGPAEGGYLKNEPHNAWGIPGADHFQTHRSGWTLLELKDLGFRALDIRTETSQHGEPYQAMMMEYVCSPS